MNHGRRTHLTSDAVRDVDVEDVGRGEHEGELKEVKQNHNYLQAFLHMILVGEYN